VRGDPPRFRQADQEQQATARLLMSWVAAELPAIFGVVHLVFGGTWTQSLLLWAAALVLMGLARPETAREI
jgi:hypothetical protein